MFSHLLPGAGGVRGAGEAAAGGAGGAGRPPDRAAARPLQSGDDPHHSYHRRQVSEHLFESETYQY